jgi:uncharacterized RDD family membrane protein YckC
MQIYIGKDGDRKGPYSETQIREMLAAGSIAGTDLAWHDGLADWTTVTTLLSGGNVTVPPAIPASPRAIDPNLAGRGSRLGAVLLDTVAMCLCMLPGWIVMMAGGDDNEATQVTGGILVGVGFLALAALQTYLLTTRGQSLGKRIVGVRIVNFLDDSNPGFVKACLLRAVLPAVLSCVPIVGSVFSIIDVCFIFQQDRRCLHDLIAGTKVVNA